MKPRAWRLPKPFTWSSIVPLPECLMMRIAAVLGLLCVVPGAAPAQPVTTNQAYVEALRQPVAVDIADPLAVFAHVLRELPGEVTVYPTENYFYFSFTQAGMTLAGNIRLDAADRDEGFLHFGYFEEYAFWREAEEATYRKLGAADGVVVERLAPLRYRVTFRGRGVVFALNDLSAVTPPAGLLTPDEDYIGPVFDESGMQFYLAFNRAARTFLYLLRDVPENAERFDAAKAAPHVTIGRRTGFAFYTDRQNVARRILIGVFAGSSRLNNYLDGPFDQLPDNFLRGDTLREAILTMFPDKRGTIDRYGATPGGAERYAISPYIYYSDEAELKLFDACIDDPARPAAAYYVCFNMQGYGEGEPEEGAAEGADAPTPTPTPAPAVPAAAAPPR